MAQRFYLPSTGASAVSPAYGAWTNTAGADRRAMVRTRISSVMSNSEITDSLLTIGQTHLWRQYVSEPIPAQTISGTFSGQVRVSEQTTEDNHDRVTVRLIVVSNDGTTVRGTLLALGWYGATNEYSVDPTRTNRRMAGGITLSSVVAQANDRIVIEIGTQTSTTPLSFDGIISVVFGDDSGTDLPTDETTAAVNNPWIEFSQNLFDQSTSPSTVAGAGAAILASVIIGVAAAVAGVGAVSAINTTVFVPSTVAGAGAVVFPASAAVVADSYSPTAATSTPVTSAGAILMVLRPTTPASLGDQSTVTGIQTSANGPAVGTLTLDATVLTQPGTGTDPISHIVLHAILMGTDITWGGIAYERPVNPLFRLKIAGQSLLTHALAVGGIFPLPESPLSVVSKWESVNITTRPQGGPWTWPDLATVDVLGVRGDYDLLTNEGSDMRVAEMWIEAFGPQGSYIIPLTKRLKAGNLRREFNIAETFNL